MVKAIYTGSEFINSASAGNEVGIVLESTNFFAEQGGQVLYKLVTLIHHFTIKSLWMLLLC